MTTIEKIRAKLENEMGEITYGVGEPKGVYQFCEELISFLDTIESEKLMDREQAVSDELEKAALVYETDNTIQTYDGGGLSPMAVVGLAEAFEAGAKWQANHVPLPEDTVLFNEGVEEGRRLAEEEQADLFTIVALDAAQRAKEQMMKEAVEGEIVQDVYSRELRCKTKDLRKHNFKFGDKVRIIIVKE